MLAASEAARLSLLSLPDDLLRKIFSHLTTTTKHTLESTTDAINLANTNNRLRRIFSATLTRITPLVANRYADTLSPDRFETLVRMAGENLRELHIPGCYHSYIHELPEICPKLEALHFVERSHISIELAPFDTDDEEDESDGSSDNGLGENDTDDDDMGDEDVTVSEENRSENDNEYASGDSYSEDSGSIENCCKNGSSESENREDSARENYWDENDVSQNAVNDTSVSDNNSDACESDYSENDTGDDDDFKLVNEHDKVVANKDGNCDEYLSRCPVVRILPRLNLRKLSVFRLPEKLCESIMSKMADYPIQELHLHRMRKFQLPLLIPLLSQPLQALTITMSEWGYDPYSERISKLIDALVPAISNIPVVTIHFPGQGGLYTLVEGMVNFETFDFPKRAASLIASVRENNDTSQCTSINLAGENTFRILTAVDRNASITLSNDRITVCDQGDGTHITSLPLYEEFLHEDVTHLEKAFLLRRWDSEGEEIIEYEWDPEWGVLLKGHRLRLMRSYDANVLNILNLSTEVLELFCSAIWDVSNWGFLTGVRELYLLAPPTNLEEEDCTITIDALLEALPRLVDTFQGEFICVGYFESPDCSNCPDPAVVIQNVKKTKESIDRFVKRGGDAATLSWYVDAVLSNIATRTDSD